LPPLRQQFAPEIICVEEIVVANFIPLRLVIIAALVCLASITHASAQTSFDVIAPVSGPSTLARPLGGVIKAQNGVLYGTAHDSASGCGGVFKVATNGMLSQVHAFSGADGCQPVGELVQAPDGHIYGTTTRGGPNADARFGSTGTIFRIVLPAETFESVHAFAPLDPVNLWYPEGVFPNSGLTLGSDGALYGTTNAGGPSAGSLFCGTIFKYTSAGGVQVLHALTSNDGCGPNAGLTLAADGNFYGAAATGGGLGAAGSIFRITPGGTFTKLYSFVREGGVYTKGFQPLGEPVMDTAGNLYGTASAGGPDGGPGVSGSGTVWRLTPGGVLTVLKAFTGAGAGGTDGAFPQTGLTLASDGLLYGTTVGGGANGSGGVFRVSRTGAFELLHSFAANGTEGGSADGRLLEVSRHVFLGTTQVGASPDSTGGNVFKMSLPVVDIDANGQDGPVTLGAGNALQLTIGFDAFAAGLVNPARIYIGVAAPFGLVWLTPAGFTATPAVLYTGPLPTFPSAPLLTFPAGVMPSGSYIWFIIVDTDGTGDTFDAVQVNVGP
jgi:uncharacterized repeat protein (TIGR03803 family)